VGNAAGGDCDSAGTEGTALPVDVYEDLAVEDVAGLVLVGMGVQRGGRPEFSELISGDLIAGTVLTLLLSLLFQQSVLNWIYNLFGGSTQGCQAINCSQVDFYQAIFYFPIAFLILALTAGEEGGSGYNGMDWLLKNHRDLIDAAFALNVDAGDPVIKNGKPLLRSLQTSEKIYQGFSLEVTDKGGHGSLPTPYNAIARLADGAHDLRLEIPTAVERVDQLAAGWRRPPGHRVHREVAA